MAYVVHFLCTGHCTKNIMCVISFNLLKILYCLSFLGKETGLERKSKPISKVKVLGNGEARVQTHCQTPDKNLDS